MPKQKTLREIMLPYYTDNRHRESVEADIHAWAKAYGEQVRDIVGVAVAKEFGSDDDECSSITGWVHKLELPEPK